MNDEYTHAPHRQRSKEEQAPNAALLIDFDNVTMGIRSNLGRELRQLLNSDIIRGKVSVQRAYADWRRYPQYVVPLSEAAVDLIYAPAYGSSKKNATDIRLAIDALELVFTRPEIGTFILLSGDSDFSSLVLKLKEFGKYVIGVGMQESSSDLLVQNCDEYYSYTSLSGLVAAEDMETKRHDPWELTEHAIRKMDERNDVMRSDRLKQVMLELDSSFDEKELGFSKFNRFLSEASSRGILKLKKIGHGQYEVHPGPKVTAEADGGPEPERADSGRQDSGRQKSGRRQKGREAAGRKKEGGRSRSRGGGEKAASSRSRGGGRGGDSSGGDGAPSVRADSLRSAYDLLEDVVRDLMRDGEPVRDSEVKREILNRDTSFDEAELGFSKFSRFIRQAHDEGVVDVEKGPDGNYYLETVGGDREAAAASEPASAEEAPAEPEAREEPAPAAEAGSAGEAAGEPEAAESRKSRLSRRRGSRGGKEAAPGSGPGFTPGPADSGESGSGEDGEPAPAGSGDGESAGSAAPAAGSGPEAQAAESEAKSAGAASGGTGGAAGASPRGIGRYRTGRQGKRPSEEAGGQGVLGLDNVARPGGGGDSGAGGTGDGAGAASGEPETGRPPRSPDEIVAHMAGTYDGVGEKTARKLVDAFGAEVFDVIDREPGRVEDLLAQHRAEAVLQARASERSGEGSGAGAR